MNAFDDSLDVEGGDWVEQEEEETEEEELVLDTDIAVVGWKRIFHLPFQPIWYISMLIIAVYQVYLAIYEAGFRVYGRKDGLNVEFVALKHISSFMYAIDIIFIIGCRNLHGLHIAPSEIRRPNWVLFADLVSIIPLELFIPMEPLTPFKAKLYYYVQLNDCLKALRIFHTFYYNHNSVGTSKVHLQILEYYFSIGLAIIIGCVITYRIHCFETDCTQAPTGEELFGSMYIAVSKITGRGIADYPKNLFWMFSLSVITFIVFMGITCVSIAYVAIALFTLLHNRYDYSNKLKLMHIEFKKLNVPKDIVSSSVEFFDMYWRTRTGYEDHPDNFSVLPQTLFEELTLDISWNAFKHSSLLRNMDIPFLRHASVFVESKFSLPGKIVYSKDCNKDKMIYVVSGVVQILSEEDDDTPILSFSAGTCLGDSCLVLNYKPKAIVRCKTFCNLHILEAKDFIKLMKFFPQNCAKMRKQFNIRLEMAEKYHDVKRDLNIHHGIEERTDYITIIWLKTTLHRLMMKDGDTAAQHQCQNIFLRDEFDEEHFVNRYFTARHLDTLAISERLELVTDTVFLKSSCPCVFQPDSIILNAWDRFIAFLAIVTAILVPYFAFVEPATPLWYEVWVYVITVFWVLDLYVQISTAVKTSEEIIASVKRIFFYRMSTPEFLADLFSALPIDFLSSIMLPKISPQYRALLYLNRTVKFWRIKRIFRNWDNQLSTDLVFLLYFKYCCILCFTAYLCACGLFAVNCFNFVCLYYVRTDTIVTQLVWCLEAVTAILTGVCIASRLTDKPMYYHFFLYVNLLSTIFYIFVYGSMAAEYALKRASKIRLSEILVDVDSILSRRHLSAKYDKRIFRYVETQWLYNHAASILYKKTVFARFPHHIYAILRETTHKDILLGVPLFQELPDALILDVCIAVRDVVMPPNEVVFHAGDICHTLHIIAKGYCKVVSKVDGKQESILGPMDGVSILESCLRIPSVNTVVTVTHCKFVTINYDILQNIYLKYPLHKDDVQNALTEADIEYKLDFLTQSASFNGGSVKTIARKRKKSFHKFGYNLQAESFEEYDYYVPFDRLGFLSFVQHFLVRYTVLPNSKFLFMWEITRCVCAILSAIFFSINHTGTCTRCEWYFLRALLDGMAWIDMYFRLHVCYYNAKGILVTHPLKTAIYYLQRGFLVDAIGVFPVHLFFPESSRYYNKVLSLLQLNRVLQMHRYMGFCYYIRTTTFLSNTLVPLVKFFPIMLVLCVCTGSVLINTVCEFDENIKNSDGSDFTNGVRCANRTWITMSDFQKPLSPRRVEAYAVYFATTILTMAGMLGFKFRSTVIAILGLPLSLVAYILSVHITSTAISYFTAGNSILLEYQISLKVVRNFMSTFNVKLDLQKKLIDHYKLKWARKRGRVFRHTISCLNRSLQQEILYDMYGKALQESSVFITDSKAFVINFLLEVSHDVCTDNTFITCVNDVKKKLYIVYKGKVGVIAPDGTQIATLPPGSLFGNLDDYDMVRQTVSIIALGEVETLSIPSLRFHALLKQFPQLQKRYKYLTALHIDYIEGRGRVEGDIRNPAKGNIDSHSSLSKNPFSVILKAVFDPDNIFIRIWQTVILVVVCYIEVGFGVYQMALAEHAIQYIAFQYVCDLLYTVNFYVKTHTAYEDEVGVIIKDLSMIKKRWFQKRLTFYCDIISLIPFEVFAWLAPPNKFRMMYSILRINKLLRFIYVIYYFRERRQKLDTNLYRLRFVYIILWSTFTLHFCTCILITLTCTHTPSMYPVINCNMISLSAFEKLKTYVRYYYIITNSFLGTSQASSHPESSFIIIYCIFLMIFLQLLNAVFIAQVYSMFQKGHYRQNAYAQYLERLRIFMVRERLSDSLLAKAYEYLKFLWRRQKGVAFPRLLLEAPDHIREHVLNSAFGHHVNNHFLFEKCHVDFNRQLVACLKNKTFFKDDYIVLKGTINKSMYFVHYGEVAAVLTEESTYKETVIEKLKPGMSFGVTQGLFPNQPYSYTFRATKTSVILCLYLDMWEHLLRFFPASVDTIRSRYAKYGDKYA